MRSLTLWAWGIRDDGPIPIQCLAWCFDVDRRCEDPLLEWSSSQVAAWARGAGFAHCAPLLESLGVNGRVLSQSTGRELRQVLAGYDLSTRLRFTYEAAQLCLSGGRHVDEVEAAPSSPGPIVLSTTLVCGPALSLLHHAHTSRATLPRVAVVGVYDGGFKDMVDLHRVRVTEAHLSSSGGDRPSSTFQFSASFASLHACDSRDFTDLAPATRELIAGTTGCDGKPVLLGVSCVGGPSAQVIEWGPHLQHWSRRLHSVFPREFREAVRTLLLCHQRAGPLSMLPRDVVEMVVARLAVHYNASPFAEIPVHKSTSE